MAEQRTHKPRVGGSIPPPAILNDSTGLAAEFERHLISRGLLKPGGELLVGCSGGPDSTALFHLLRLLPRETWKLRLRLVHLNHGMRGSSASGDREFVRKLAKRFGVPFHSAKVSAKTHAKRFRLSPEEAARALRYRFFAATAKKIRCGRIALAHTLDDQAETVLMRVIQGTGSQGLLGIREQVKQGNLNVIRPLLFCRKERVLAFLEANGFSYRRDETNREERYLRNRLRLRLIPQLEKEYNPRIQEALARIPVILKEEEEGFEELVRHFAEKTVKRSAKGRLTLDAALFLGFPAAFQFRVLNRLLARLDPGSGLNYENWMKLRSGLDRKKFRASLKKDIDISISSSNISIYKRNAR